MAIPRQPGDPGYIAPNTGLLQAVTLDRSVIGYEPRTATPERPTATGYTPTEFHVDNNQTVSGQLSRILAQDSPLLQQARARAAAEMNSKGLLNTSIAIGAGEAAAIGQALPVAQQDARTYEAANTNTVNARNAAAAFRAGAENTAALRSAELGTNINLANAEAANIAMRETAQQANQILNTRLTTANQMAIAQLDANTRTAIANIDNRYRQLLQASSGAQSMVNQAIQNIASIAMNNTMSRQAKDAATASQLTMLNEGLQTLSGVASMLPEEVTRLDLGRYFRQINTG